ncbi:MAG: hypothetical protein IJV91_01860, partial [Kiritimatiellae bacterium]|nr:hypothetical protein [Kiritimatiellia bacterium]
MEALKEKGLQIWLYDERGYPSGYAYGLTLEGHPELQAKGYLIPTNGGPVRIEPIFKGTHAEVKINIDRRPYPNILMREATERFLEVNHEAYVRHLGASFSNSFVSTFTDEPSLMSHWLRRMPDLVLPYSPELPDLYMKRTERILSDDIKTLAFPDGSPGSRKIRYDYWNLVGELLTENFFGVIDDWCRAHGLLSGGHLMCEENLADHVGFYGDFFSCLKRMSAPGIDMLTIRPPMIARRTPLFAGSARALGGRKEAMVEISDHSERSVKPKALPFTMDEANGAVNLYIWGGITAFPSYLSVSRMKFPDDTVRAFNRRTGRLVTLFSRPGEFAADVALVYPASDLKANYIPMTYRGGSAEIDLISHIFTNVEDSLFRNRRPCLVVDEDFLQKARIENGCLVDGRLAFRSVVLPGISTMPLSIWKKLLAFRDAGGVVMAVGAWPRNDTDSFPSKEVSEIAERIFEKSFGNALCNVKRSPSGKGGGVFMDVASVSFAGEVLNGFFGKVLDVESEKSSLRVQHRRMDDGDAFLVFNDSPSPVNESVRICGAADGFEMWNPDDGTHAPAVSSNGRISLDLRPYGAVVLTSSKRCRPVSLDAPVRIALPMSEKGVLKRAPFETFRNVVSSSEKGADPFRAKGTVVAAGADTYHWVNFEYAKPPMTKNDARILIGVSVSAKDAFSGASPSFMVFAGSKKKGKTFIVYSHSRVGSDGFSA